ncbi:F0F1 ATP synthase subunit B [Clostridium luticellarii]|jgi:F-type H+-transporting ATPase subunit b|uniref:ATP synthase subunit b n=1 Tax=Clostridium luticellarii TaxID=1691940 RepID=A0A2T0BQU0_9CLOT|nr:F0F1 ATP synthase subunit B [Clostridium luticellarii]MCI1945309.1 F0F1 ATP synthase subunit B [Clostridium luticellarii]MCI1968630.1 F0F1 ATP synthase subunit B [Clostridium luticellarii]MCI1995810.1 F0F1 ATP synthase subunit B [Clostridium luticellarii]MCI2040104.1 F0F1 ATP synthase subunit B [Clostridium luticellarii]PRR86202.1 ATP synthase subunit b, sodium ion specific [Clostridium luticellarii]
MEINLTTVIITIINFIVLYLILKHFFFAPVNSTITTRQEEINSKIRNANENEKKSQQLVAQHDELLRNSKKQGRNIVEDYKNKAERVSEDILGDAHKEAQLILDRAKVEAERQKEKVQADIKNQVVDLAMLVSAKALEGSIDEKQHRKLIEDFIAKVGI